MNGEMRDIDPPSIAVVRRLLTSLRRLDLTPDDRATIELIHSDIETAIQATSVQGDVPEAQVELVSVSRELVAEIKTIANNYA
jgi:hypothetical protein